MGGMIDPVLVVSSLIFLTTILSIVGVASYRQAKVEGNHLKRRVAGRASSGGDSQAIGGAQDQSRGFARVLEKLGGASEPKEEKAVSDLKKSLIRAGLRSQRAPKVFLGAKAFGGIVLLLGFAILHQWLLPLISSTLTLGLYVGSALIGFYAPNVWLRVKTTQRKEKILKGFPSALDLMVVCVEAGLGLDATIKRVGQEIKLAHVELFEEFQILELELRSGQTRRVALRNLSERTDLDEIKSLVALLIQTDRFGTSLAQALRVHSDSMRWNRRQKAEEKAAKLPVKLLFPLIMFIFPNLFVVILGPALIQGYRLLLPVLSGDTMSP